MLEKIPKSASQKDIDHQNLGLIVHGRDNQYRVGFSYYIENIFS
jgi:hypothetical protein